MELYDCGVKVFDDDYVKARYTQYCKIVEQKLKDHQKPHDRRYKQGFFIPKRAGKCINVMETLEPQPVIYRSSWELDCCNWFDENKSVLRWGSEIVNILYKDPIKNKTSFYVPDFYAEILDKNCKIQKYLLEVKPLKEATLKESQNGYDKLMVIKNSFKWQSAIQFCKKRNMIFKVITERDLGLI